MTNEKLISRAIKLGAHVNVHPEMPERPAIGITVDRLQALLAEVVATEREACAKACEEWGAFNNVAQDCAAAIRARGQQ